MVYFKFEFNVPRAFARRKFIIACLNISNDHRREDYCLEYFDEYLPTLYSLFMRPSELQNIQGN